MKYIKLLFIAAIISAVISVGYYIYKNSNLVLDPDTGKQEVVFGDEPKHDSDDLLVDEGQYVIEVKHSAVENYLTSTTYSSALEMQEYYLEAKDVVINNSAYLLNEKMYVVINLESELGYNVYLKGTYSFKYEKLNAVEFSWYDDELAFSVVKGSKAIYGKDIRGYNGDKLNLIDCLVYFGAIYNSEVKYVTLNDILDDPSAYEPGSMDEYYFEKQIQQEINKLANSVYTDLFNFVKTEEDDNQTTIFKTIDVTKINQYINEELIYDYGVTPEEAFENHMSIVTNPDDGELEVNKELIFEYVFRNKSTLNKVKFYVLIDIEHRYSGIYYQSGNNLPELLYYQTKEKVVVDKSSTKIDMTNYEYYAEADTGYANTYYIKYMSYINSVPYFNENTFLVGFEETDLPLDFVIMNL